MNPTSPNPHDPSVPTIPEPGTDADGERISITDVHGTVARFEMAYSPPDEAEVVHFGPPLRTRLLAYAYGAFSVVFLLGVIAGHFAPSGSVLFAWVVDGDRTRPVSSLALALIVLASGVGSILRAHMRGVLVHKDGVEARYVLAFGVPRVRRWAWAQVHRLLVDDGGAMIELWDGGYVRLPPVAETKRMTDRLGALAMKRGIQVTALAARG